MFDCFEYVGLDRENTQKRFFLNPKKRDDNVLSLVDNEITDMFKLDEITTNGEYKAALDSYSILLVLEGQGLVNGKQANVGDRFFITESEKELFIYGSMKVLVCRP